MEISSETRFKIFCSKKVQTSIKENNLRTKEGRLNILHEKKKSTKREGNKTIVLPKFSNEDQSE